MQSSDSIKVLTQRAATGDREAFTQLIDSVGRRVRLVLSAHVESFSVIAPLEQKIWTQVYGKLNDYDGSQEFSDWVFALAVPVLTEHLQRTAARVQQVNDLTGLELIETANESLISGSELQVVTLGDRIAALPDETRELITARYRHRYSLEHIAKLFATDEASIANALVTARARCDWREIAKPPAAGDHDLPPRMEELFSGVLDNASRLMIADFLSRDHSNVQQMARQVRVQIALRTFFMPFAQAIILARQALAGQTSPIQLVPQAPNQIPVVRHPACEKNASSLSVKQATDPPKTSRISASSHESRMYKDDEDGIEAPVTRRKQRSRPGIPIPYLIIGVVASVVVLGLLISTLSNPTPPSRPTSDPSQSTPSPLVTDPQSPAVVSDTPPHPKITDSNPPGAPLPVEPLRVDITGIDSGSQPYVDQAVEIRCALSREDGIARVEYWNDDNKLGEANKSPWICSWTPAPGAHSLSARAVKNNGEIVNSPTITVIPVATHGSGHLRRDYWIGIQGSEVKGLDKITDFPNRPTGHELIAQFATAPNFGEDYLQRVWGYVTPPLDGDYVFWIAADDEAELWLSKDDTAETRQRIAISRRIMNSGTKLNEWDRQPEQRSATIQLKAGRRYLIEALHKEGKAYDHLEVGWQLPNGNMERPIPGIHLSPPELPTKLTDVTLPNPDPTKPTTSEPTPAEPIYKVVRAINLGGDAVKIDDVDWLGQRDAETEGETPANSQQPAAWLSDLEWKKAVNGYGEVRRDKSTTEGKLTIAGKVYAKGLGAHAQSEIVYALNAQLNEFSAIVGIDDKADGKKAAVTFQVWLDNKKAWDSGLLRKKDGAKAVKVSVVGHKELRLIVDAAGDVSYDHANWAEARFMRVGGNDGLLQVVSGRRSTANFTPTPAVDAPLRSVLGSSLSSVGKEPLEFLVRVPNGPLRIWLLTGEPSTTNSRQFEVTVGSTTLPIVEGMAAGSWQKLGPIDTVVSGGTVTVKATPTKGAAQLMGFIAEQPDPKSIAPILSPTDPLAKVPDAIGYKHIYGINLSKLGNDIKYTYDQSDKFNGSFSRVAYLLELQEADKPLQWVWTSMDAFTTDIKKIDIPTNGSDAFFQEAVKNLFVVTNVTGLPSGAVGDGYIEFWSVSYKGNNAAKVPGATDEYDFGDNPQGKSGAGYGSMQVHNLGARETVWAVNHWVAGAKADLGIGPSPKGGDWTHTGNASQYSHKRLRIYVK